MPKNVESQEVLISCFSEFRTSISPLDLMIAIGTLSIHLRPLDWELSLLSCLSASTLPNVLVVFTGCNVQQSTFRSKVWFCNFSLIVLLVSVASSLSLLSWVTLTPPLRNHFVKSHLVLEHHSISMVSGNYDNQIRSGSLFGLWWDHISYVVDLAGNASVCLPLDLQGKNVQYMNPFMPISYI